MKRLQIKKLSRVLTLVLMCLLSASAYAQGLTDQPKNVPQDPPPEDYPCNISIVGDFESACVLPLRKEWFYNEHNDYNEIIACQGMTITYTAYTDMGGHSPERWEWEVAGEVSYDDHGDGTITVSWGEGASGQLMVTVYGPEGISCTKTVNVRLIEKPHINVETTPAYTELPDGTKVIYVCKGETVEFTELSATTNTDIVGYYWESMTGGTSSTQNYTVENVWTDDHVVHRVYNNCGCYDEEKYEIRVMTGEILELSCYGTVCEGREVTYTAINPSCNRYVWYVEGGHITGGQYTSTVSVRWDDPQNGYGVIAIDGNLCGDNVCPTMLSKRIPIIENNIQIKGQTTACVGEAVIYSIPLFGSTEYHWYMNPDSGYNEMPVNGANEQMYVFTQPGTYRIYVTYKCDFLECGEFTSEPLIVTVKPPLSITGDDRICINNTCDLSTSPAATVNWKVYDMDNSNHLICAFPSLTNLSIGFPHTGKYLITAENDNYCRVAEFILTVLDAPEAPTVGIFDPDNPHIACANSGILLKATPENPDYTIIWEPVCNSGSPESIAGNEVTINYGNTVCDVEAYTYDRILGCRSADAYVHTVVERTPLPINIPSPITVCPGTKITWNGNDVPYQDNFLYKWKIQENMQHCASIQGSNMSNNVTLAINNHTSNNYPVNFYVTLERRYCDTAIYDTIHIIVRGQDSVAVNITQSRDTVCPGDPVTFTGHGGDVTAYKWKTDESNTIYTGQSFTRSFTRPGDHTITLMYSVLDYCTNTEYYTSMTTHVHVLQKPVTGGMYLNSADNIVGVYVPTPNNYSFTWYYGSELIANAHSNTIDFQNYGCYTCVITDNTTGCSKTVYNCFYEPSDPCNEVDWEDVFYDPCTAKLHLETQVSGSPVHWSIVGGDYNIAYTNDSRSQVDITFDEACTYYITAYSTGDNCEISRKVHTVSFIPIFTFEKKCTEIVIHNQSKYMDGNTMINMSVNGVPGISFHANDEYYSYPISANGSYTFQMTQPYNCHIGTVDFGNISGDELTITASNGSDPIVTCDNKPLTLTASLASNSPISSTRWSFSDGTYFTENGNTFYHTYKYTSSPYYVTATVIDQNGCPISETVQVRSHANVLEVGGLSTVGDPVCPYGDPKMLTFASSHSGFNPAEASYQWNIGNSAYNTLPTYYTANYSVFVTNNYFCEEHAQKEVVFKTRPTAIIVADKYTCCVGDEITLYGAPGPDADSYSYAWDIQDPYEYHSYHSTSTVTIPVNIDGVYKVSLNITNDQGCSADANTVYINVYPTPAAPVIGYGSRLCLDDPPVELVGNSPVTNDLHWSNGNTGNTAYYFTPGSATSWYYDPVSGCKSFEAHITIDAQPDFDALLTGCYEKCPDYFSTNPLLPVWGLTSWMQDIYWDWYYNGGSIASDSGSTSPLMLPLIGFGDYFLDVNYNYGNCHTKSPSFTIVQKDKCDCEGIGVTTKTGWYVKNCQIYYDIHVDVCNNSDLTTCFKQLDQLFDTSYMNVIWTNFGGADLNPGECFSFDILLEVNRFHPSHTAAFQLLDLCNDCTTLFSIDLSLDNINCDEPMKLMQLDVIPDLSSDVAAYFKFKIDLGTGNSLLDFWMDPPMVIDYNYDGTSLIHGLGMVNRATLSQLVSDGADICFYAITCRKDQICKRTFCLPAQKLYDILESMGYSKNNPSGDESGSGQISRPGSASGPRLTPNPATGEVNVTGTSDKVIEIVVMDMNGRKMSTFDNTPRFDISHLPSGIYIVRVKTLTPSGIPEKITYLKLIRK